MRRSRQDGHGEERSRLARELKAMRLEPRDEFVRAVASDFRPRSRRRAFAPRIAVVGVATAALLVAIAAVGGVGGAASRVSKAGSAVAHVAVASSVKAPSSASLGFSSAAAQYGGGGSTSSTAGNPNEQTRAGYCSVAGNTTPTGVPYPVGTFLNLLIGQPDTDPNYKGATPAFYIKGIGLTCNLPGSATPGGATVDSTGHSGAPGSIYSYYTATAS